VAPRVPLYTSILRNIEDLPDSSPIPLPVASMLKGISRDEVKKRFRTVKISERRLGVLLGDLRSKREVTA
jgi:hypothetical protein